MRGYIITVYALIGLVLQACTGDDHAVSMDPADEFEMACIALKRGEYAAALRGWRALAERGDANAQYQVAGIYTRGDGLYLSTPDDAEAIKWYKLAAEQGHSPAQFSLAFNELLGVPDSSDRVEAVKWLIIVSVREPPDRRSLDARLIAKNFLESPSFMDRPEDAQDARDSARKWIAAFEQKTKRRWKFFNGRGVRLCERRPFIAFNKHRAIPKTSLRDQWRPYTIRPRSSVVVRTQIFAPRPHRSALGGTGDTAVLERGGLARTEITQTLL